jgi:membrane protein DedA with SNARE-associated domain
MLLGTQYKLVDKYSQWFDIAIYVAIAVLVGWLAWRRIQRKREARQPAS